MTSVRDTQLETLAGDVRITWLPKTVVGVSNLTGFCSYDGDTTPGAKEQTIAAGLDGDNPRIITFDQTRGTVPVEISIGSSSASDNRNYTGTLGTGLITPAPSTPTGAHTILIIGVGADGNEKIVSQFMGGVSQEVWDDGSQDGSPIVEGGLPTSTRSTFIAVNGLAVATRASDYSAQPPIVPSTPNVGRIWVGPTAGNPWLGAVPNVLYHVMEAGDGLAACAFWYVANGQILLTDNLNFTGDNDSNSVAQFDVYRDSGPLGVPGHVLNQTFHVLRGFGSIDGGSICLEAVRGQPPGACIWATCQSPGNASHECAFHMNCTRYVYP